VSHHNAGKLPVFCLVACVRMRYFTCAH